jgi:hypothetical protein
MESQDPKIQEILGDSANLEMFKRLIGLEDLQIPDEDARAKQLVEIEQLLEDGMNGAGPIAGPPPMAMDPMTGAPIGPEMDPMTGQPVMGPPQPSVEVDPLLDHHEVEFEAIVSWATSEEGQQTKLENPMGYANVRAHAEMHYQAIQQQAMQAAQAQVAAAGPAPQPGGAQ